ncbi:MAG: hypothetical protein V4729_08045 [Pseudomonadota bacterium]
MQAPAMAAPPLPAPAARAAAPALKAESAVADHAREARAADAGADAAPPPARRLERSKAAPADDYRLALQDGRFAEALERLPAPVTAAERVDRELLLWQQHRQAPGCTGNLEAQALLCEALQQRAAGQAASSAWHDRIESSGLVSGPFRYRRALVQAVFGAPK